ncbi:unnamed protein product [Brachionus calyciflorus]|uniref:Uncharacterized protein n=1 Tax=Brachionus calyciflorus TaxID=104777 RepID=A0A814B3R3_9BILA|nr:unnamed protein product [Brachionus calyciflorus]
MSNQCDLCYKPFSNSNNLITLSDCAFTICNEHLANKDPTFECPICHDHTINKEACLAIKKNRLNSKRLDYIENLNTAKTDVINFQQLNHESQIDTQIEKILATINSKRDEIKQIFNAMIDDYSNNLIEKTNEYKLKIQQRLEQNKNSFDLSKFAPFINENPNKKMKPDDEISFYENKINSLNLLIDQMKSKVLDMSSSIDRIGNLEFKNERFEVNVERLFGRFDLDSILPPLEIKNQPNSLQLQKFKSIPIDLQTIWAVDELSTGELVVACDDETVKLVNFDQGEVMKTFRLMERKWLKFGPKGLKVLSDDQIISWVSDGIINFWNRESEDSVHSLTVTPIKCMDYCEKTHKFVIGNDYEVISIWTKDNVKLCELADHEDYDVTCLKLMDENKLVSGSKDGSIYVWSINEQLEIQFCFPDHQESILCLGKLNDKQFISGSEDCTIRIWDIDSISCLFIIKDLIFPVVSIQVVDDLSFLTCNKVDVIEMWKKNESKSIGRINETSKMRCFKYLKCGKLICGLKKGNLSLWK